MDYKNFIPQGASYQITTGRETINSVSFSGNKFESFTGKDKTEQVAKVLHNNKLSVARSTQPNSTQALVQQAAEMVPFGSDHDVPFVGATTIAPMNLTSDKTLSPKEMADIAGGLMADLQALDSRISASASVTSKKERMSILTSDGFDNSYSKTNWNISGNILLTVDGDSLGIYESDREIGPDFNVQLVKDTIAQKLEYAKNTAPFKAGVYPVIFSPMEANFLTLPFCRSLGGQAVYQKVSPWGDKLGQTLLDPRFTLVDDATIDRDWRSLPFDREGTPTRRNVLIQNGRLENFILDRKFAARLGMESTGNGNGLNYLHIDPGTTPLAEMIKSIDYGLLIEESMGAWSGNPYAGIVSGTIATGLLIENGQIKGRVKDCMFTINAFDHFKNHLLDISKEVESCGFMSPNRFPYIALDQVVISSN